MEPLRRFDFFDRNVHANVRNAIYLLSVLTHMRAFLTSLLLFALFAAFFYMAALLVLPSFIKQNVNYKKGAPGYLYSRIKEIRTAKNTDLLFLGSSKAYRGFDPRIFEAAGYRSFNLGSSNQTPIQTYLLV